MGIFVIRDTCFYFFINRELCSMTKWLSVPREKLELIIDIRDIISYFSLMIFSFKTSGR